MIPASSIRRRRTCCSHDGYVRFGSLADLRSLPGNGLSEGRLRGGSGSLCVGAMTPGPAGACAPLLGAGRRSRPRLRCHEADATRSGWRRAPCSAALSYYRFGRPWRIGGAFSATLAGIKYGAIAMLAQRLDHPFRKLDRLNPRPERPGTGGVGGDVPALRLREDPEDDQRWPPAVETEQAPIEVAKINPRATTSIDRHQARGRRPGRTEVRPDQRPLSGIPSMSANDPK